MADYPDKGRPDKGRPEKNPQPVDVTLDGRKLFEVMKRFGVDLNNADQVNELLRSSDAKQFQIRDLDSVLERARANDWEISVTVTVRY